MRVLYIPSDDDKYGAPKSLMELIKNLRDNYGVEPVVLTCSEGNINKFCKDEGIESHILGQSSFMVVGGSNFFRKIVKHSMYPLLKFQYWENEKRVKKRIEELIGDQKFDLVHTNVNRIDIGGYYAAKHNIPHIWHLREFGKEDYNCFYLRRDAISFMNKTTTKFIAISKAVKQGWIKKGLDPKKIDVIYNGVDLSRFPETMPKEKSHLHVKFNIVFAGIISETKGQLHLIKAISMLPKELQGKINVDFWGGGRDEYIKSLKRRVQKEGLQEIIHFKGYTTNLPELLPKYDIGVVASRAEAFGRVTVEYMAAGLCVVASDTGANPEIVTDHSTGLIYKYGDIAGLRDTITWLIENPDELIQMRINAFNDVRKKYSMDLCAKGIFSEYQRVIKEKQ